ncbi:MAG TPA: aminotransferase class III-fold pyridoxal phosphate-dependent enzyme [Rhizomicrobium sp.]|jgi:glutamate-1-semialdehyde 2,1-aminomutase|nr:aminotransferase class III-fold pyridoxal phosphate-dependent enzyme [Rhizomicrobium sp.]
MDKPVSSETVLQNNRRYIPGGISSVNRSIDPAITFVKGEGAYLWDSEGKRYIDYHAGFAPYFLGHNFAPINRAAAAALTDGDSLFGAGPSIAEGRLAQLICENVPAVEKITLLNTGSEATSLAVRIARAVTGRFHIIVMQGGYNGNHDELACNVFNTLADIGPRVSPGEYPLRPLGAGTTVTQTHFVHAVNYNDLESVRYVCRRYPVAALITEPLLQNIGVVKPQPGYLEGLRDLADAFGFLLVFDEVKTGFRHAVGGYAEISGVKPDLVVYGKAVANGFPLAVVGGRSEYMDSIIDPDPARRPFVAGTYNGHPVAVAAAIETVRYLVANRATLYPKMEALGARIETGIMDIFAKAGITACVTRQGSAFSFYLMEKFPTDLHDIVEGHDFARDVALRRALIQRGVFFVPIATKQCSLSAAHTSADVAFTLEQFESAVAAIW